MDSDSQSHNIHIVTWNVNGWTLTNSKIRESILKKINPDIICLTETHLTQGREIKLEGYHWYGHNRSLLNARAKRGSGGVGILVKDDIFNIFKVVITDKCYEGILCISLTHKHSDFDITVIVTYLPPENSVWGRDSSSFFSHLLSLVYSSVDSDIIVICGDFNARISNLDNYKPDIDDITRRISIDNVINEHG